MPTSPNEDGRPTQGGAAQPVHVMNPAGSGVQPVSGTVNAIITNGTDAAAIQTANSDGVSNTQNNLTTTSRIMGFNGTTWDRIRTAVGDAMAATGLLALANMLWNGATWDRWKGDNTGAARVSLYGKGAAAGDTGVLVDQSGIEGVLFASIPGVLPITLYMRDATRYRGITNILTIGDGSNGNAVLGVSGVNFNGTSWDRQRNNHEVTVLASAARTASVNSSDLTNYNARGVIVVVDITALAGGSITVAIKGKDTLSGKYTQLLASAALSGTGTTQLIVFPGITVAANLAASAPLPRIWRVEVTAADGSSITYSIGANYCG